MCSFLYTTKNLSDKEIEASNRLLKYRGPDNTNILKDGSGTLVHNRLKIEGDCVQPYRKDDIIVVFNGEIYNYIENEAAFIIDCYKKYGDRYASYLDGEFAIVLLDLASRKILISADTFKTKPIWVSTHNGIHASTYKSALISIGCADITPLKPNTTLVYTEDNCNFVEVTSFDLKQYKDNYNDFLAALDEAIIKRTKSAVDIFIGLSSGYDSGCIAAKLINLNRTFSAYAISNKENKIILDQRKKLLNNYEDINYNGSHGALASFFLKKYCESSENTEYNYQRDISAKPLMYIAHKAKLNNCKVFISGTGSDEIYGDYFISKKYEEDKNTCFQGRFPDDLTQIFPWNNFFNGTMRKYLTKDEYIIGSLGIEARYPFLDKALVQEFLWLLPNLKNLCYKAPLQQFLEESSFPYCKDEKLGFNI